MKNDTRGVAVVYPAQANCQVVPEKYLGETLRSVARVLVGTKCLDAEDVSRRTIDVNIDSELISPSAKSRLYLELTDVVDVLDRSSPVDVVDRGDVDPMESRSRDVDLVLNLMEVIMERLHCPKTTIELNDSQLISKSIRSHQVRVLENRPGICDILVHLTNISSRDKSTKCMVRNKDFSHIRGLKTDVLIDTYGRQRTSCSSDINRVDLIINAFLKKGSASVNYVNQFTRYLSVE